MNFKETMDNFLSERKDDKFYDSSVVTYKRKLEVFFEYLELKCGINDSNYEDLLRGIGRERIIESIEYYVKEYDIKFSVTVEHYNTVIKCYFRHISEKYKIRNENFDSEEKYNQLKEQILKKIESMNLNRSKQKSPINSSIFNELNQLCNEKIDSLSVNEIIKNQKNNKNDYNKTLVDFISAVIVKVVMFTGIKNQVVNTIKVSDYNSNLNKIKINDYWIYLPDKLSIQMKKYKNLREKLVVYNSDDASLFVNKQGEDYGKDYTNMFEVLKPILGSRSAESVSKYTIMNMIKNDIDQFTIKEFTSFGMDTILHCQELVNEQNGKKDFKNKNSILNSKLRTLEMFDKL